MKYALLIHPVGSMERYERLPEEEQQAMLGEYLALVQEPGIPRPVARRSGDGGC